MPRVSVYKSRKMTGNGSAPKKDEAHAKGKGVQKTKREAVAYKNWLRKFKREDTPANKAEYKSMKK